MSQRSPIGAFAGQRGGDSIVAPLHWVAMSYRDIRLAALTPEITHVLRTSGFEAETPPTRRIFTNRDLDFDAVPVIGFDMDYTLARYDQEALERLSIEVTVEKMLLKGYPEQLKETEPDPQFAICGLVVDRELGNLLKMDRHGYVGRVYHGKIQLPRSERKRIYRAARIGHKRERFAFVDTGFSLPEVTIFAKLVDLIDHHRHLWMDRGLSVPSYAEAWNDVREAIDASHQDESIKKTIKAEPERFFRKDPDLAPTLHKLRSAGKKLFLLTNSYFPYTDAVLSYLLSGEIEAYDDWTVYFDWIIVGGQKPRFFTDERLFNELDRSGQRVGKPVKVPMRGRIYEGGCRAGIQDALAVEPDEVLYIGDHIYGDIVLSKKSSGWRTALVVDDLEHELAVRRDYAVALSEIASLSRSRDRLAEEISMQRHVQRSLQRLSPEDICRSNGWPLDDPRASELLDDTQEAIKRRFERLRDHAQTCFESLQRQSREVDAAFNPYWGSVFAERQDASMYGAQIENYACLYTSRVSNFQYISPVRYFHAPHGSMPHWQRWS